MAEWEDEVMITQGHCCIVINLLIPFNLYLCIADAKSSQSGPSELSEMGDGKQSWRNKNEWFDCFFLRQGSEI